MALEDSTYDVVVGTQHIVKYIYIGSKDTMVEDAVVEVAVVD